MKVHIKARCRDYCRLLEKCDEDGNIELPDNLEALFKLVELNGRFELIEPNRTHHEYGGTSPFWTLFFQNDYD